VKSPVLATVALVLLLAGGLAVGALAGRGESPNPPTKQQAQQAARDYDKAIDGERAVVRLIDRHRILSASTELNHATFDADAGRRPFLGGWSETQDNEANDVLRLDLNATRDLENAQDAKGAKQDALLRDARRKLIDAIGLKKKLYTYLETYTPPPPPPSTPSAPPVPPSTPPAPTLCIDTTNNGSTTSIIVHVSAPGRAGAKATFVFAGENTQVTLDANGSASDTSTVSQFGSYPITVTITAADGQTTTVTATEDLSSSNDVTTSNCH
jgi:hypothetical protein